MHEHRAVVRSTSAHVASRAGTLGAQKWTFAPKLSTFAILTFGALSGITTCAGMPRCCAAYASAAPWLPDECVTTPRARRPPAARTPRCTRRAP
jgi:hypothetical protein